MRNQSKSPSETPAFSVRYATRQDASLISEIGREAFEAAFGPENNPDDLAAYLSNAFSPAKQEQEISRPGSTFLIAESEGKPAGYARLQTGGPAPDCIPGNNPIELVRFYLLPAWIGHGNGSRLMQFCLDIAWGGGHDAIWLSTWKKNTRGLAFYKKWGFEIVGEQTFQVGSDPQEDWLLALRREGD